MSATLAVQGQPETQQILPQTEQKSPSNQTQELSSGNPLSPLPWPCLLGDTDPMVARAEASGVCTVPTGTGLPASSESQPQGAPGVPCHRVSCSDPRKIAVCPATGLASLLTMGMSMDEEFVGPFWSGLSCGISGSLARPESWGPHFSQPALLPQSCPLSPPTESFRGFQLTWLAFSRFVMIRPTSSALDTKERGPETSWQPLPACTSAPQCGPWRLCSTLPTRDKNRQGGKES